MLIIGVDVGSVRRKGGFSWASSNEQLHGADDPSALGALIVSSLDAGDRVALAFECPLSVPVQSVEGESWKDLGRARAGEGNRSWSASAGTAALATGIVQLAWLCRYVADNCTSAPRTTTQLSEFEASRADLLLAEAMVTSDGKPEPVDGRLQDHADAVAAAKRLAEIIGAVRGGREDLADVMCSPAAPLNLAAVAAMHAGLAIPERELHLEVLVAKVRPVAAN